MSIEILVGSYEEFVLAYRLLKSDEGTYKLQMTFANHAHLKSVRSMAACSKFVASGGADETVRLLNMKSRKDVGTLMQHDGTITCLDFFENSYLFSGSDDGTICAWTTSNWQCIKTLRGHKSGVLAISLHPTGKLLLSVSKDKTLRTWNTVKGRITYVTNIKNLAEFVQWSPDGVCFLIGMNNRIDVYNVKIAGIVHVIEFGSRVTCVTFITADVIAVGGEGENIEIHNISKKSILCVFKAHSNRIKSLKCIEPPERNKTDTKWIISASSDGYIKVWELCLETLSNEPELVTEVNTDCRLTCMAVWEDTPSAEDTVQENKVNQNVEECLVKDTEEIFTIKECGEGNEKVVQQKRTVHFSDDTLEKAEKKRKIINSSGKRKEKLRGKKLKTK